MKKENIRDYFVNAMRLYAQLGKPTTHEINILTIKALEKPLDVKKHFPEIYKKHKKTHENNVMAESEDLKATVRMLERLENEYGKEAVKAIEFAYMINPSKKLQSMDITNRVRKAATELHMDESSINRRIAIARHIFAEERGLRNTTELLDVFQAERLVV